MSIYHFHVVEGERRLDDDGTELANDNAARDAAIQLAGQIIKDEPSKLGNGCDFRVEVANDDRHLLFTVVVMSIEAPPV